MRRINYIYTIIVLISLTSCGSPYRLTNLDEVVTNKDISFVAPNTQFQINKKYSSPQDNAHNRQLKLIDFNKRGMQFKIYTELLRGSGNKLFRKNGRFEDSDIRAVKMTKVEKETGVTYLKAWIPYINGLKCQGYVFSRGFGGSYAPFSRKSYNITCGYYDSTETNHNGERVLLIGYNYTSDPKENYEQELKYAVKKAISTLKIKNIDTPRMKREGLLHPHRRFKSTKW